MKYKYVVFCPYFGKLPKHFNLWLISCSYNKHFKFIVFTDDNVTYSIPKNVEIVQLSFDQFVQEIQKKFDFQISLCHPYKLCDFKPAYGYIFDKYLNNCKYWGYCDLDLIFGNLEKFLPTQEYDKISYLGHLCLMKNIKDIRESFMLKSFKSKIDYKNIFSSSINFGFDEIGNYGINEILEIHGYKIFNYEKYIADINCLKKRLTMVRRTNGKFKKEQNKMVFSFEKGKIFNYSLNSKKQMIKEEYAYIHFQKRKMYNNICNLKSEKFIITYNKFVDFKNIKSDDIMTLKPKRDFINILFFKYKFRALKNRLSRFYIIKKISRNKCHII